MAEEKESDLFKGNYLQVIVKINNMDGASFWLKDAIKKLDQRDPVDAWIDADVLARIFKKKMDESLR